MTFSPGPASFIPGPKSASPSRTRGGSRVPEWGPLGSVRGALSNERPYRDLRNVGANYAFEKSRRFAGSEPNSGHGDHSRLSCGAGDTQLGRNLLYAGLAKLPGLLGVEVQSGVRWRRAAESAFRTPSASRSVVYTGVPGCCRQESSNPPASTASKPSSSTSCRTTALACDPR